MFTAFEGDEDMYKAIAAGAQGYVLKNSTGEHLVPALRTVAAGNSWMPVEVAKRKEFDPLTSRELEVLQKLAKGPANKEKRSPEPWMCLPNTVKDHLKAILTKLHVADRTEAVTVAIQRSLIHL